MTAKQRAALATLNENIADMTRHCEPYRRA